ncbi:1906_t:CDS:1, partial [Acaulospora colombiana]
MKLPLAMGKLYRTYKRYITTDAPSNEMEKKILELVEAINRKTIRICVTPTQSNSPDQQTKQYQWMVELHKHGKQK